MTDSARLTERYPGRLQQGGRSFDLPHAQTVRPTLLRAPTTKFRVLGLVWSDIFVLWDARSVSCTF